MIRVTLYRRGEDDLRGFVCSGHAGYASSGHDIICAAVSILTNTCVNALESVAGVKPRVRCIDGLMSARLPEDSDSHDAQVIMKAFDQGLRDLQSQYPAYVRVESCAEQERRKQSC